jgi:hypothetical protein
MSLVFFLNITPIKNSGLCNQLYSIVSTILRGTPIIVSSPFLRNINTNNFAPISKVINMKETNKFLKKYNTVLLDSSYLKQFKLVSVKYASFDVTLQCARFLRRTGMFIRKTENLNILFGVGIDSKKGPLEITFTLNYIENQHTISFATENGFLVNDINIEFIPPFQTKSQPLIKEKSMNIKPVYSSALSWEIINQAEYREQAKDIFKNLVFSDYLTAKSNKFITYVKTSDNDKVNIIHLRLEADAIEHWSAQNNMSSSEFKEAIVKKYIGLIEANIEKSSKTILLTYDLINPVSAYLKENGYNYYFCPKEFKNNREESAIVDLMNSRACNNVFIGVGGSTFSDAISKFVDAKKIVMFDINKILG